MSIKSFDEYNEGIGYWLRSKFNKDEEVAQEVYRRCAFLKESDIKGPQFEDEDEDIYDVILNNYYEFEINRFQIRVSKLYNPMGTDYKLSIDEVDINASEFIVKKIYKRVDKIYYLETEQKKKDREEKEEEERFTKKDIKIEFRKRNESSSPSLSYDEAKDWILNNYTEQTVNNMLDEEINSGNWIDEDQMNEEEYESNYDYYVDYGRGEAEQAVMDDIVSELKSKYILEFDEFSDETNLYDFLAEKFNLKTF